MEPPSTADTAAPAPFADPVLDDLGAVFDHVGVAAPRIRDLLPIYHDLLGGRLVAGGDNARVGYRALQLGFSDGTKIELMEPHPGSTFFDSFFRRNPRGGMHHVTFKVRAIEPALEALQRRGYSLTGLFLDDISWQEVFLHPREAHGVLVQLAYEGGPGHDPPGLTLDMVLAGRGGQGTGVPSP